MKIITKQKNLKIRKGTIAIKEKGPEKNIEKNITKVNKIYLVREIKVINDLEIVKVKRRMLIKILNHQKNTAVEINQVKGIERSTKTTEKNIITRIMMTRVKGNIIKMMIRIIKKQKKFKNSM